MNPILKTILLVLLALCVIPVLGITLAIVIPQTVKLIEKSKEGATKENLSALRSAVSTYHKDHKGKWPKALEKDLVPKYIDAIHPVKATGAFVAKAKSPVGNKVTLAKPGKVPTTSGEGWLYDSSRGKVYVNSTVKDSKKIPYSFYGAE